MRICEAFPGTFHENPAIFIEALDVILKAFYDILL